MGRKSIDKSRKNINNKVNKWLAILLLNLQNKDIEKLTMDDFAILAKKSKSTIYSYFQSKEEILLAACKTKVDALSSSIFNIIEQDLETLELYELLVKTFAEGTSSISISFLQNVKKSYPTSWSIIEVFTDNYINLLREQYKKGIEKGIFNTISIDLLSQLDKIFVLQVVTNPSIFNDKEYSVSELITQYLNLRLTGLLKK
ncbi:MAG: TetR/AcrR family transcriptional regulator [Polaribacter sp.]